MRVNVHCKLRCVEMFWYLEGENSIISIIILFQKKFEPTFITLSNVTILGEHGRQFLLLEFLRITLFLFSHFVFVHFFIHFLTNLFGISRFCLIFLFFSHVFFSLSSLLLFNLTFFKLEFACLYGFI